MLVCGQGAVFFVLVALLEFAPPVVEVSSSGEACWDFGAFLGDIGVMSRRLGLACIFAMEDETRWYECRFKRRVGQRFPLWRAMLPEPWQQSEIRKSAVLFAGPAWINLGPLGEPFDYRRARSLRP